MVEIAIIREWVAKADEDFEFALVNLKECKPFAALICFHFHQSAEKYLKAFIVAHDLGFQSPTICQLCSKYASQKSLRSFG
jgi:HEPN domain-containing protein